MPLNATAKEVERVMRFCNACRYCEGFCAVFPAMELRRTFSEQDLNYLANLCHNCRDCYYACQYIPPHEFELNIPKAMAELRLETYREFCWPGGFKEVFKRNAIAVVLTTMVCTIAILTAMLMLQGNEIVFSSHVGSAAFYKIIPYDVLVSVTSILALFALFVLVKEAVLFWRKTGANRKDFLNPRAHAIAITDALRLKYLAGGGYGCNYPDEHFSMARRWLHHLVFYGFALCFGATVVAAFYEHFLNITSPFPIISLPVVMGTIGGIALLVGTAGLLYLKTKMDRAPTTVKTAAIDYGFLILLFMVSLTGLLLLVFRETSAMGILFAVHLGCVAGFFLTMPYGKFIHTIFRYAALVKNAAEQTRGQP
ncbi:MAG: tricarballylate utilization 4Fe-4S protein TcuB [Desulfobacterales bacterium]|jgi:citrate/tricarballylate utilization protein